VTLYDWLKVGHILGAMIWVGGGVTLVFFALRVRASGDPAAVTEFGRTLAFLGPRLLAPSVIAVLVFGLWMIPINSAWNFGQAWILLALVLFAVAFLVGAIYLSRIGIRLGRAADGDGAASRALLDRWLTGYAVVLVVLLVAVWDMVFKPGV
jgi:uncharacterized membrane protein